MNNQVLSLIVQYAPVAVSFLMPFVIQLVTRDIKDIIIKVKSKTIQIDKRIPRFVTAMFSCFVAAVVVKLPEIRLGSYADLEATFGLIFVVTQSNYNFWFKSIFANTVERSAKSESPVTISE